MEQATSKSVGEASQTKENQAEEELECAVCLQTCIHPVKLPCSHIFCFLCVKGVANQSKRCAMCRQEIPADFLEHPILLKKLDEVDQEKEGYQWFYEGRNGWWQYDERTSNEIEAAFGRGERLFEILVAGFLYSVDYDRMVQQRRNDPSRRRRIKRDLATIPKKGVAGLKTTAVDEESCDETDSSSSSGRIPPLSTLLSDSQTFSSNSSQLTEPSIIPEIVDQHSQDSSSDEPLTTTFVRSSRNPRSLRHQALRSVRPPAIPVETSQYTLDRNSAQSDRINHLTRSLNGLSLSVDADQSDDTEEYLLPLDDDAL